MLLIMGLTACSEEEVNTYSADEGIYFNQRIRVGNILTDSTNFTFVYIEESQNEATVSIPVQLVGRATDEPRPVNIKVVGGSAKEGDDFVLPVNPVLPAGASSFNYEITLKRSTALRKKQKRLSSPLKRTSISDRSSRTRSRISKAVRMSRPCVIKSNFPNCSRKRLLLGTLICTHLPLNVSF